MHYLIQNSGVADTFASRLITELISLNISWTGFGCTPDGSALVGLEDIDYSKPTILFGSTRAAELIAETSLRPGVFFNKEWYDPSYPLYHANRNNMLNVELTGITVEEFKEHWIAEPYFIKSVLPKLLTGQVVEPEERATWFSENTRLKDDDILIISQIHNIDAEIRFFIVGGKIVTGSYYRKDKVNRTNIPVEDQLYKIAQQFSDIWLPHETIVMDICQLRSGEFKIVEFNSLNSSGLYRCSANKIILSLEEYYG